MREKLQKDDLENALECLQTYEKQIADIKTSYDCFVYPTNNGWKAVIDIDNVSNRFNAMQRKMRLTRIFFFNA